jgi:PAS domain S-box-containing protein
MASLTSEDLLPLDAAIAILAGDHSILSWNQRAESLTGYTSEALERLNLIRTIEPAEMMHQMLLRVHAGEPLVHERLYLRTADGKRLFVDVYCVPLRSCHRSEARMLLMMREVAQLQGWQRHQARLPLLARLAGSLSHEIRNPMNAIFLHTDILEEEVRQPRPDESTQVTQSLETIKAEVTRLHALIQDYLFLARLSDLHPAPADLAAIVEEIVHDLQAQQRVQGVTLIRNGLDDLGEVPLHQSLLRHALLKILQLLIEAMPRGATLTLSGRRSASHVQLWLRDPGKMMPIEGWVAFQDSLQGATQEAADLAKHLAREIIRAHGGEVQVRDEPGAGMMCTITLPLGTTGSRPAPIVCDAPPK